jgi:hypothetical protein
MDKFFDCSGYEPLDYWHMASGTPPIAELFRQICRRIIAQERRVGFENVGVIPQSAPADEDLLTCSDAWETARQGRDTGEPASLRTEVKDVGSSSVLVSRGTVGGDRGIISDYVP